MTLSRNFSFRDKVLSPLPEEIDWAQALTWFAWTYLPLVVGMAGVRICSGWQWWWILIPSLLLMSCSLRSMLNPVVLALGDSFLKTRPWKEARVDNIGWWGVHAFEISATCSGGRAHDVISSRSCICPRWERLAALEACPGRKGGHISSSRKPPIFFWEGTSLGFPQDIWKVAWTIGSRLREASPDWWIFICVSIRSLVGESESGFGYLYSFLKKTNTNRR